MDIRVVRVRRPETIASIRELLERAIAIVIPLEANEEELYAEWVGQVQDDAFGLFIGIEDGEPRAAAVVCLPTSHAMIAPQMLLAYNEGRPELARRVGQRVRAWLIESGYSRMWAINLRRDDQVFMRGTAHFGYARVVASMIEYAF